MTDLLFLRALANWLEPAKLPICLPVCPSARQQGQPAGRAARASGSNMSLASEAESISIQILSDNQFFTVSKVFKNDY